MLQLPTPCNCFFYMVRIKCQLSTSSYPVSADCVVVYYVCLSVRPSVRPPVCLQTGAFVHHFIGICHCCAPFCALCTTLGVLHHGAQGHIVVFKNFATVTPLGTLSTKKLTWRYASWCITQKVVHNVSNVAQIQRRRGAQMPLRRSTYIDAAGPRTVSKVTSDKSLR